MLNFFSTVILPLAGTFLVGALGWVLTHFALNPILRFYRLRELAHEIIEFHDNVSNKTDDETRYDGAVSEIRRIATQLRALHLTSNIAVLWYFRCLKYNPQIAGSALIGLSNSLNDTFGEKAGHRWDIQTALKLPLTYKTRPKLHDQK